MPAKVLAIVAIATIATCVLCSCAYSDGEETVGDLMLGEEVLLPEGDKGATFVVVNQDKEATVLIRQSTLQDQRRFSKYSSYYGLSEIDQYLNSEYLASFGGFSSCIVQTPVVITSDVSIGVVGEETETVFRHVFLPSYTEIGFPSMTTANVEGSVFQYYAEKSSIRFDSTNQADMWFLRTPNTSFESAVFVVDEQGTVDVSNASDSHGIRPALSLNPSTKVDNVKGETNVKQVIW